jgi:hypothetical protein
VQKKIRALVFVAWAAALEIKAAARWFVEKCRSVDNWVDDFIAYISGR